MSLERFQIILPADMHCHFRQDEVLELVAPATARQFHYAVAMPNTTPPITTVKACEQYLDQIRRATHIWPFRPLGTAYVNEDLDPEEVRLGFAEKVWHAAKLYPRGGTSNSEFAAESLRAVYPVFETMQEIGMPLLIHGEVVGPEGAEYSRWDRETIHAHTVFPELRRDFPKLKIVREHVSTKGAVEEVFADESGLTAATITPHHALLTDADVSRGGLHTQANCMPIIKGPEDRDAIQSAMISGDSRFFAGTDSAPWDTSKKYSSCCSFGAFTAPGALAAYAAVFEQNRVFETPDGVERFEKFMSLNGPTFYGIPASRGKLTFTRNTRNEKITTRFLIQGRKILEPNREIIALFHEELGLAPDFPWIPGTMGEAM